MVRICDPRPNAAGDHIGVLAPAQRQAPLLFLQVVHNVKFATNIGNFLELGINNNLPTRVLQL